MKLSNILPILLICLGLFCESLSAQKQVYNNPADPDCDGIPEASGQDKCPSTIDNMQGRRAMNAMDEVSGQQIIARLPINGRAYLFQERTPLYNKQLEVRNKMAIVRRERNKADEKYGKYAEMKNKDRKADRKSVV